MSCRSPEPPRALQLRDYIPAFTPMMRRPSRFQPGALVLLFALVPTLARADKVVVAFSSAVPGYFESRMKDGQLQPSTYVFMQGQFYGGATRDRSLEKTPFSSIVNRLAIDLKEQAFFPARSLAQADLLLLVHWGVTVGKGNDYTMNGRDSDRGRQLVLQFNQAKQEEIDSVSGSHPDINTVALRGEMDYEILQNSADSLNAAVQQVPASVLLGFSSDLHHEQSKLLGSEHQRTLLSLLEADRYFIVVIAYDQPALIREKKLKRLWSCRLSIRSPGVNFPIALDRMGQIGGTYFGTEQTELKMVPAKMKRPEVKIGEAIVIEYESK